MKKIIFALCLIFSCNVVLSQAMKVGKWRKGEQDSLEKAQHLFDEHHYDIAFRVFEVLQKEHPNEDYLKYVTAVCGLHRPDMHEKALAWFEEIYKKNQKTNLINFYLATCYHLNYKFDESIKFQAAHIKSKDKLDAHDQTVFDHLPANCENGKVLLATPRPAKITNLGSIVNTEGAEYAPVISSDESIIIYTYRGPQSTGGLQNFCNEPDPLGMYFEDVFSSNKKDGEWQAHNSLGSHVNGDGNDAPIALSPDGQLLFIFRDDRTDGGDIYLSQLIGTEWTTPERLKGDINTLSWEGSCSLSADEKTLYFASERSGGYGGRDLYKSIRQADGTWGTAINLGDKINTKYDDDAPFIHPDGRTLIFSSVGHNSMGDYDIFESDMNPADSTWNTPINLGFPINSTDDDRYYVLSGDGKRGYYASGKPGGQGLHDLYMVEPGISKKTILALLKGRVTLKDVPVEAEIVVEILNENKVFGVFKSNSSTGNYLITLPSGQDYKVTYKFAGYEDQFVKIEMSKALEYLEKISNINFLYPLKSDSSGVKPINENDPNLAIKDKPEVKPEIKTNNPPKEGLVFKVQIAAFKLPDNYSYNHLKGLGDVEQYMLDAISRFTIGGNFMSLDEANAHCAKVRAAGQTDAFVTALYNGKRVYLQELEKMGLIPPQNK